MLPTARYTDPSSERHRLNDTHLFIQAPTQQLGIAAWHNQAGPGDAMASSGARARSAPGQCRQRYLPHPASRVDARHGVENPQRRRLSPERARPTATSIVTGGRRNFVRVHSERLYGVPREQMVASTSGVAFTIFSSSPSTAHPVPRWWPQRPCGSRAGAHRHSPRWQARAECSRRRAWQLHRPSSRDA